MGKIVMDEVRKVYHSDDGDIVAVEDANLHIDDGEFIAIVGPSGSGKSTLMRMVAGLEDISGGTISIGNRVINNVPPQNRGVAMVFQNYALYPHMSVRKNMSYGLKLTTDLPEDEITQRVEETATMMGIEDQLEKRPGDLSGGQQQRVATGRAIVRDPEVFLMDEPLSNLDAKLRMHMRTELQRIQNDLGTTTIYVTHDQSEAMTMADRIVILSDGVIQQVGSPEVVYAEPRNQFVADFIGSPSMNFFDVTLSGTTLVNDAFEYDITSDLAETVEERRKSGELVLGIRPEHIEIADSGQSNTIEAELEVLEHEGSDNFLYLRTGDQTWTVRVPGDNRFEEGEQIDVVLPEDSIHLFDGQTDENLRLDSETRESYAKQASEVTSAP